MRLINGLEDTFPFIDLEFSARTRPQLVAELREAADALEEMTTIGFLTLDQDYLTIMPVDEEDDE